MIDAAEQLVAEWARASLAPTSLEDLARRELGSLALLLRRAPRQLDRIATIVQRATSRPGCGCSPTTTASAP